MSLLGDLLIEKKSAIFLLKIFIINISLLHKQTSFPTDLQKDDNHCGKVYG